MIIRNSRDLGQLIRDNRLKRSLTQNALAARVGVSRKWLIDVESGKRASDLKLILRTLNVLGIQLDAIDRTKSPSPGALDLNAVVDSTRRR
jgi:HTH-type transcriptional regulator / antitoxin HipB